MWRRSPVVSGSFYPSNPQRLRKDIEKYLQDAKGTKCGGEPVALLSPHAGYVYSGPVAGYSYNQIAGSGVEVAVVLAPSHRARFNGASIVPSGVFETPLGDAVVDGEIGEKLEQKPHFRFIKEAHEYEHSLEVQVPFLQVVLKNFKLVPVVIGSVDLDTCRAMAEELVSVLKNDKRRYVVILSTDLSHYFTYDKARSMDSLFIERLKEFDTDRLYRSLAKDETQACGEGPVLTGLFMGKMLGARAVEVLKYANSGDTAGPKDQVVGYLSAAIVK